MNSKLWKLLNSGFFLWILTSVILGGATQLYQVHKAKTDLENNIKDADFEIESRLSQFLTSAEPLIMKTSDSTYRFRNDFSKIEFIRLWTELKQPPLLNKHIFTTYADFQKISLTSVMMLLAKNLKTLGHDINEAKENNFENWKSFETKDVKKEIQKIDTAVKVILTTQLEFTKSDEEVELKSIMKVFYNDVILQRWQWSWPYVDCSDKNPFC
jgi:hypothetical protein